MAKKDKLPTLSKQDPLEPIDITTLGSNGDPCFGKGYDLSTKECKLCGDSELCAFRMSQDLNITRKELNDKKHFKDLDILEDVGAIKKYMRNLKRKGLNRKEIINQASEKFEVPSKDLRKIYKEIG
jgi:hypothetical protein